MVFHFEKSFLFWQERFPQRQNSFNVSIKVLHFSIHLKKFILYMYNPAEKYESAQHFFEIIITMDY